ncbi:MAG: transglycosylase domain-containing protein [Microthrixaceae bacterium]
MSRPTARRRRRGRAWVRRAAYVLLLGMVSAVGVVFVALNSVTIPDPTREIRTTSFVCTGEVADRGCTPSRAVAQFSEGGNNRIIIGLADMSPHLINAVIAAEDRSFFRHGGVDPWGITRAALRDVSGSSASRQGGSTITQQYVKQVYLSSELTLTRKIKEAAIALKLERRYSKAEILDRYLNEIYLGRGAVGVEAASRAYFDKDAGQLDIAEAAFLAGLIRAPKYADEPTNPAKPGEAREARRRRHTVLVAMREEGYISTAELAKADAEPFDGHVLPTPPPSKGPVVKAGFAALGGKYLVEWIRQQVSAMPGIGERRLYGGGLRIYTTIDMRAQIAAQHALASTLDKPDDPSSALVSLDDAGRIVAMIGGQDFDRSEVNLALGRDGGGTGRQAGSTFKPIALAEYVGEGNSVMSQLYAPSEHVFPTADDGKPWTVDNFENEDLGLVTVEKATWLSSNTAYAQMMSTITPARFVAMAQRLGIVSPVKPVMSSVLGSTDVSVLEMATMYSVFADHGIRHPPYLIRRIEDSDGKVLYDATTVPALAAQNVIDPAIADTVSSVLTGVIREGTGKQAAIRQRAAGKTGTTTNHRDAWFAGYTCRLTAVVWMGYPGVEGQPPRFMDDVHGSKVTGGSLPALAWRRFMNVAAAGEPSCGFRKVDIGTRVNPPDPAFAPPPPSTTAPPDTTTTVPPGSAPVGPGGPVASGDGSAPTTAPTGTAGGPGPG